MTRSIIELEKETQQFWSDAKIFQRSLEKTATGKSYTFYDGPPFATGLPHYGHMLAHTMKDAVTRYKTAQGFYVERRFGWDTHGLPIENNIEKKAKDRGVVLDKQTAAGRADFNEQCRATVLQYTKDWKVTEERVGRFVDMDNDYKTMNPEFMESVWWVFKTIYEKNLVHRGKRVVAYSPGLETPISDFEAKEAYKTVQDPQIVVSFSLQDESDTALLVWTTTPWTMLTNVGIAVNNAIPYVKVTTQEGKKYILAEAALTNHFTPDQILFAEKYDSALLIGKKYIPLFHTVNAVAQSQAFFIVHSDHVVSDGIGTGLVHLSPAFGEDDFTLGEKYHLPTLDFFDAKGRFQEVPPVDAPAEHVAFYNQLQGIDFKAADKPIIAFMKAQGMIFSHGTMSHEYPFCYRTERPLMYRAIPCWFIAVTKIKAQMLENNAQINWFPEEIGKKRFNNWLLNARDWNVSRNRYWGTPIPIWENIADENDRIVIGSRKELEALSGVAVTDLHSHFIDQIEIVQSGKTYRRVSEVFDCWFESGSMPYAQAHYPFEHSDDFFQNRFPAQFIAEGLDQTRGWFYTLLVISTALFNKPPFLNCMVNGILLGNDGKKMSKSKGNYPPLDAVLDQYGADALRFVLLGSSATRAESLAIKDELFHDAVKDLLIPTMNIYKFFEDAVNAAHIHSRDLFIQMPVSDNPLDQWLIWRTENCKEKITHNFENYNLMGVCRELKNFVEDFSKWYIRNIKFFLKQADYNSQQSLHCLHFALETFSKCAAPIIPFISEYIYRSLFGAKQSVHLQDWPKPLNAAYLQHISEPARHVDCVREIVALGYKVREQSNIPLSQPLPMMYLNVALSESLRGYELLICRTINVERIEWQEADCQFDKTIRLNHKILGPLIRDTRVIRAIQSAITDNNYVLSTDQTVLTICGKELKAETGVFEVQMIQKKTEEGINSAIASDAMWVVLDSRVTPELLEKYHLRALEREVMKLRKQLNLAANDYIEIVLTDGLFTLAQRSKTEFCQKTHSTLVAAPEGRTPDAKCVLDSETRLQGEISVFRAQPVFASAGMWQLPSVALRSNKDVESVLTQSGVM